MPTSYLHKIKDFIEKHALLIMVITCCAYLGYFTALSFLDHRGLRTQLNDLGHMEQAIWQITKGDMLMKVTDPIPTPTPRFYYHANLIFYLIAPLYTLLPSPYLLLFIGVLAATSAGLILFLLARKILKSNILALVFGFAFLANPLVQETILYDFHPIILAFPFLFLALLSLEIKKWWLFWTSIILMLLAQEDMPFLAASLAPFVFFYYSKLQGLFLLALSVSYWIFLRTGLSTFIGKDVGGYMWHRLGDLGSTPEEAMKSLLQNPIQAIAERFSQSRIIYLSYIFIQGGFLAVWAPLASLLVIPNFAQNVLAGGNFQIRITGVYYSGIIIATLFAAAIYGIRRSKTLAPKTTQFVFMPLFIAQAIIFSFIFSPSPHGLLSHARDYGIYHDEKVFKHIKSLIPKDASVATQNNLGAHFAARNVIVKPNKSLNVDYVLLHFKNPHAEDNGFFLRNPGMSMAGNPFLTQQAVKNHVTTQFLDPVFSSNQFGVVMHESSFYLLKRNHSQELNDIAYQSALQDIQNLYEY